MNMYDPKTFVRLCDKTGYSTKKQAEEWVKANPKPHYADEDFLLVYRDVNDPKRGGYKPHWHNCYAGGQMCGRTTINNISRGLAGNSRRNQDC